MEKHAEEFLLDGILESVSDNLTSCRTNDQFRSAHTDGTIMGLTSALKLLGHETDYVSWTNQNGCLQTDNLTVDGYEIVKNSQIQDLQAKRLRRTFLPQTNLTIYQINPERDNHDAMFVDLKHLEQLTGSPAVDSSIYDKVYTCSMGVTSLEEVFTAFNAERPEDFTGHSLSVSDVIEVKSSPILEEGFYFCNSFTFDRIPFDPSCTRTNERYNDTDDKNRETGKVLEPGKLPEIREMTPDLSSLQTAVGGYIEAVYPYEDPIALIVSEEGKLEGKELNRALRDREGNIYDVLAGTAVVVGLGEEDFITLTDAQIEKYERMFHAPEMFSYVNGKIVAVEIPPKPKTMMDRMAQAKEKAGNQPPRQKGNRDISR